MPCEHVRTVRVLDFMETTYVSGPAKNLIEFARHVARTQSRLNVQIAVATFYRDPSATSNEFVSACREAGLEVHLIRERSAFDKDVIPQIRKIVASFNPHLIQTHAVKSHFLVRLCGLHKTCKWIAFHHGYTWTNLKVLIYNQLDRWSLPASSNVVTVCHPFASALQRHGVSTEKIAIQHNAVNPFVPADDQTVSALREKLGIPGDTPVLLSVGRLSREKGHADLLNALKILRRQQNQRKLRLLVVGDGPDRQRLERLAVRSGITDWVTFVGHQSDVAPYYTLADLMVLPSRTEGSPNALLEAMAAGLPTVATAVGGVPEIISTTSAALLVRKQDPFALARAIEQVLGSQPLREQLSCSARTTASRYSRNAYSEFLLSLYQDVSANQLVSGDQLQGSLRLG